MPGGDLPEAVRSAERTYAVSSDATDEELLAAAKLYARAVVDAFDLSVSVRALAWETSTRAKRRAGAVKHRDGEPVTLSLTRAYFDAKGWSATAAIVRHELVHVHLLNEHGETGHGERFREWARRLGAPRHCERFAEPRWWVVCRDCDARLARYRRSKLVERPTEYRCGACGGELRVEAAEAPDETTADGGPDP